MMLWRISPSPLTLGIVSGALVGPWLFRHIRTARGKPVTSSGTWTLKSDSIVMNDTIRRFMDDLSRGVPADLVVTSGIRTANAQAAAMLSKLERGQTGDDLLALYVRDDLVNELLATGRTQSQWAEVIQAQIDRGDLLSSHLSGRAVDLRTSNLSDDQRWAVMAEAQRLGAEAVDEGDHIHIEGL